MDGSHADRQRPDGQGEDVLVTLERALVDERGSIQPLVDGEFRSAQLITSKAGAIRANHYHKTDSHYMYLVSGAFDYYHRPAGSQEPPKRVRVCAGQMVYTPPMVDHAVEFIQDTVFVNFSASPRDQAAYETDVVRIEMVNPRTPKT